MSKSSFIVSEYKLEEKSKIYNISPEWKKLFAYLNRNVSKDKRARPTLAAINIEKNHMIATNGFSITVVKFRDEVPFQEGLWQVSFLEKNLALFGYIDGKYPDWRAIFNPEDLEKGIYSELKTKGADSINAFFYGGVTSTLLADLLDTKMDHNHNAVSIYAGKGPWRFDFGNDDYNDLGHIHIYGCLMPVHTPLYESFVHGGVGIVWKDAA